jgi:hypothetical protein
MRYALAILCLSALTGCGSMTATKETNLSACAVWKDITWSKKDTDQTITEIKVNNARRDAWCQGERK